MLPKTYLDRMGRKSNKYVFISYSHRDKGYVFPMLKLLYDAGVDFWYDKELNDGEVWNEEIHEIITSSDCVGTIFFLSENAILSNAICQEVRASVSRIDEHEFYVLPVLVGLSGYQEMLKKIAASSAYKFIGDFSSLMKNEDRVMRNEDQRLEDFQPLSKAANDAKRQFCKECRRTGIRYDAKKLGYPMSYYKGAAEHHNEPNACEGCYWYDPLEFKKHLIERK